MDLKTVKFVVRQLGGQEQSHSCQNCSVASFFTTCPVVCGERSGNCVTYKHADFGSVLYIRPTVEGVKSVQKTLTEIRELSQKCKYNPGR